jgi:hypothetical protein
MVLRDCTSLKNFSQREADVGVPAEKRQTSQTRCRQCSRHRCVAWESRPLRVGGTFEYGEGVEKRGVSQTA